MKMQNRIFQQWSLTLVIVALFALTACEPELAEKSDLGEPPIASFVITQGDTPNDFILTNTSADGFLTNWDLQGGASKQGQEVAVNYPSMGTYEVTMTTFNRGGSASTTQILTVTQDEPIECVGNFEILTGCGDKVWQLAAEAGALNVGPAVDATWWANGESDIAERSCHFDDTYTFTATGAFIYENNGDFWTDSDGDGNTFPAAMNLAVGCQSSADIPEQFQAWSSGTHAFTVSENTLTVIGEGAWMGLYKIGTSGEVSVPQQSVTLNILELTEDRMVLYTEYDGGVFWRLTFTAN